MPFPVWTPATIITAQRLTDQQWHTVRQGADQIVNGSTTFVNTSIIIPLVANAIYRYHLMMNWLGSAAGDIKFDWSVPAGASMNRFGGGPGTDATTGGTAQNFSTSSWRRMNNTNGHSLSGAGLGVNAAGYDFGEIIVSATAGNATLRFAQNTSDANDTTFSLTSYVDYLRIA